MYKELKNLLAAGVVDENYNCKKVLTRNKTTKKRGCICFESNKHKGAIYDSLHFRFFQDGETLFYFPGSDELHKIKILDFGIMRPSFLAFKHFLNMFFELDKVYIHNNCPFSIQEKINALYNELQDDQRGDMITIKILYTNNEIYKRVLFFPLNWNF